jgi:hypothetical protein
MHFLMVLTIPLMKLRYLEINLLTVIHDDDTTNIKCDVFTLLGLKEVEWCTTKHVDTSCSALGCAVN